MFTSSLHPALMDAAPATATGNRGVLSAAASGLGSFITRHGGDIDHVFGVSGIDPALLASPTLSLGLANYCQVMEEAASHAHFDNFGLHYGKQFKPQALGLIGYIGLCSATLEQALANVVAAFPFHQHDTLTRWVDTGECWRFDYQVRHGAILCRRQDAELTLGMILNLIRHALGPHWAPREVYFEHPRPEQWHEHCKVFDAPVYFEQPVNALVIPKQDVRCAMPESDPVLLMVLQDTIRRLNSVTPHQGIVEKTRSQVQLMLSEGEPMLERVAERLGMSGGSLQRRLHDEAVNFSSVVDGVRRELAAHYLQQRKLPVSDMALLLGYSETSAFSRAFKRWFGASPRQWRKAEGASLARNSLARTSLAG